MDELRHLLSRRRLGPGKKREKEAFRILGRVHCQKGYDVYVSLNHRSKNLETNSFVRPVWLGSILQPQIN